MATHASPSETTSEATSDTTSGTTTEEPSEPVEPETTETTEPTQDASDDATDDATTAPTPNFRGLCKAFQANDKAGAGKSLDSAAFTALAALAALATTAAGQSAVVDGAGSSVAADTRGIRACDDEREDESEEGVGELGLAHGPAILSGSRFYRQVPAHALGACRHSPVARYATPPSRPAR